MESRSLKNKVRKLLEDVFSDDVSRGQQDANFLKQACTYKERSNLLHRSSRGLGPKITQQSWREMRCYADCPQLLEFSHDTDSYLGLSLFPIYRQTLLKIM
jgi:hypothetical protein